MPEGRCFSRWTLRGAWPAAALLALALAIRLSTWPTIFQAGKVFLLDGDDYYHLRRMMMAAADFPFLPALDRYMGFPAGSFCRWPPLYDCFVGWLGLIVGFGRSTFKSMATVAALVPPLAGVATLAIFYRVAAAVLPRRAALLSLAIAALLPLPAAYTLLGRPDHHCFENLWFMAALLCCLKLLETGADKESAGRQRRLVWAAGAALALGNLFWFGSIYFSLMIFAFVVAESALLAREERSTHQGFHLFPGIFLVQIPILLLFCGANHWYGLRSFDFDAPSLFQPVLLAALGSWALFLGDRRVSWGVLALAASVVLAFKGVPSLAAFFAAPAPIFRTVEELQPLFGRLPHLSLDNCLAFFGYALWPALLLAGLFAFTDWKPAGRLILAWFLATGALSLVQLRYGCHFSLPMALLLGYGLDRLWSVLEKRPMSTPAFLAPALVAAGAIGLLLPALRSTAGLRRFRDSGPGSSDLVSACDWIRLNTPATRSLWKDEGTPEYGVFALHDIGAQIAAIAQRPAAAGNLHWLAPEISDSLGFFFEPDSERAYGFLRQRGFRYVLLTDMVHDNTLVRYARLYGLAEPRLSELVSVRLHGADGSLSQFGPGIWALPADRFRLVYESPSLANGAPFWKLFEAVPGALLTGRCRAGLAVTAQSAQLSVQNRGFTYLNVAPCGADRRFKLRMPYAGLCTIGQKGSKRSLPIAEADIESGASKELSLLP
jgi:dolichyl-diphosphooligosaccharide--protein glycosyltransferase